MDFDEKLEALLLERELVTATQLTPAKQRMKQEGLALAAVVEDLRLVEPVALAQAKAELLQLPYVDLAATTPNEAAMRDISRQAAATYRFFAFDESDGRLLVAMASPEEWQATQAVTFIAQRKGVAADIHVATPEGIEAALGAAAVAQAEVGHDLRDFGQELAEAPLPTTGEDALPQLLEEAPITKVAAVIIRHAIEGQASDIHIEPSFEELRVRYRIDGALHTSLLLPLSVHAPLVSRLKVLSHLPLAESQLPQQGRFASQVGERAFDFRVATMPTIYGEKVLLRIVDTTTGAPNLAELGFRPEHEELLAEHLAAPHGLIVISGPAGSGISTTLFSAVSSINQPERNIVTLEDPVEYELPGVNQTQVDAAGGVSFATGLRTVLRQDADVILVSGVLNQEVAGLTVQAALAGHLVLAGLPAETTFGAIERLLNLGLDAQLLQATLRLLVAQRLVTRLCQACAEEQPIPEQSEEHIREALATVPEQYKTESNQRDPQYLYQAAGCEECQGSGRRGRLGIFEVLPLTADLRAAIGPTPDATPLETVAQQQGYITLQQDGILKSLAGEVAYEDVIRVTS